MRVLVLGGYGNFGARICRALAHDPSVQVLVAGRNAARARVLADSLGMQGIALDVSAPGLADRIRDLQAGIVVHTAGPFQAQDYVVARAAAAAGAHYIDLADGRRFVCDFAAAVDAVFRAAGRVGISGASTVPALSAAVVDQALARFGALQCIETCIAPAQRAPRGEATLAGVLSYCGEPLRVWREGRWQEAVGWASPTPVRFARLGPRLGALCDIPDLELFPARYPQVRDVMFRAALEVRLTQHAFAFIARLRRLGLLRHPQRLARLLHRTAGLFDGLGTPDGGMVVRLRGTGRDDRPLSLAWHVTAPDHHGPEIPCMAAILLVRRLAAGEAIEAGARPCAGLLALDEFAPEFRRWGMSTEWTEELAHGA